MLTEQCALCGGTARLIRERTEFEIGNRKATVDAEKFRCDQCGESYFTPEQATQTQRSAAEAIRRQEKLLVPSAIRAIRKKLNLTQSQLEQLLGTGPKTVVRWEKGTVFQNRAADQLLRCLDAVPAVFPFLAAQTGLDLCRDTPAASTANKTTISLLGDGEPKKVVALADFKSQRNTLTVSEDEEAEMPVITEEALK